MKEIAVRTTKRIEALDVTAAVQEIAKGVQKGVLFLFVPHCTAALLVNEFDPNLENDYEKLFSLLEKENWRHDEIDDNAAAHLASAVAGTEKFFFIEKGRIVLGTWQRIILMELDGPRERKILCEVISL